MSVYTPNAKRPFGTPATKASMVTSLAALLAACGGSGSDTVSNTSPVNTSDQDAPAASVDDTPTKVTLVINTGDQAAISETGVDQLDIVFKVSASFDAKVLDDNAIINLGLDAAGTAVASLGRADFDELSAENATLNIHATQKNVEVDYKKGVEGNLTINFENNDGAIVVGEDDFETSPNQAIQIFDAKTLNIHHLTDQSATVQGTVHVDGFTEDIIVTTSKLGGDLSMIGAQLRPTFEKTNELKTITVNGFDGDLKLISFDPFHGVAHLIDDATKFQSLDITGHDADIEVGSIGYLPTLLTAVVNPMTLVTEYTPVGFAPDLETINISLSGSASLHQHPIAAHESDIAEVIITAGAGNPILTNFSLSTSSTSFISGNVVIEALGAQAIERMVIDTTNGGDVILENQSYLVTDLTFRGSGDIIFSGIGEDEAEGVVADGQPGFEQAQAADASDHTGDRLFYANRGKDVIYGSDGDDTVVFTLSGVATTGSFVDAGDAYFDSGGNDSVYIVAYQNVHLYDGDAGTDDGYFVKHPDFGSFTPATLNFFAGSGNDTIEIGFSFPLPFLSEEVSIDFGTWLNGTVEISGFKTNSYKISLDGLPGITTTSVETVSTSTILTRIDDNQVYLGLDGDQVLNGQSVTDYTDLSDVAAYLNAFVSGNSETGDSAVFILENGTVVGREADYYFYLFNESDGLEGISAQEIVNFASVELPAVSFPPSGPLTAGDFV